MEANNGESGRIFDTDDFKILRARCVKILAKLAALNGRASEGLSPRPDLGPLDGALIPALDDGAYEHFRARMVRAKGQTPRALMATCWAAEAFYVGHLTDGPDLGDPNVCRRLLDDWRGYPAHEAAVFEGCRDLRAMRRLWRVHGLDPNTGREVDDVSERDQILFDAIRSGAGEREAARRIGIAHTSARAILDRW